MTDGVNRLKRPIRRRRMFIYIVMSAIIIGLVASALGGISLYGLTVQALFAILSGVFLAFSVACIIYLQLLDLRRAEHIIALAQQHGGAVRIELLTEELWVPEKKARSVMRFFEKKRLAVARKTGELWTFPALRSKQQSK